LNRRSVRAARFNWRLVVALLGLCLAPTLAAADPIVLTTPNVPFLIPVNGQSGTLTIYSNGSAPTTSGFNALGSQTFTLGANSTSSGSLLLNLVFSGQPLGSPISNATSQFTVTDLDFFTSYVTSTVTLKEAALISYVNGSALGTPINLASYLPTGTTITNNQTITLDPIALMPPLSSANFTNPFVLSLTLSAVVKNSGSKAVTLLNTPESIVSNVSLSLTPQQVPEPSMIVLLGAGLTGLMVGRRRRTARQLSLP
jgi:hypothetical protein